MSAAAFALHAFADEAAPARALAGALGVELGLVDVHAFPDGEILPTIAAPGETTVIYRSLSRPNDKLIALLLACEAWRRRGARRLVLVAPYLCYMRQDTAFAEGQAISQRALGDLLGERFERIITVDAHLHRTASLAEVFPGREADDLNAAPAFIDWLAASGERIEIVCGPDEEAARWVRPVADALGTEWLCMRKRRRGDRDVEIALDRPERVRGRTAALLDDVCSSGGTMVEAIGRLREAGAARVVAMVTHALFDAAAEARLRAAGADRIVSTDAIVHPTNAVPLAGLLAAALRREASP
jgi:ribose-phosphate pyrophosphokinase